MSGGIPNVFSCRGPRSLTVVGAQVGTETVFLALAALGSSGQGRALGGWTVEGCRSQLKSTSMSRLFRTFRTCR